MSGHSTGGPSTIAIDHRRLGESGKHGHHKDSYHPEGVPSHYPGEKALSISLAVITPVGVDKNLEDN